MANKNISGDVNVEFTEAQSRQSLESGESVKTLFGKIRKWLSDLKAVAFSGSYNDLTNKPTIPPAVAVKGNAETEYRTGNVNLTAANIGAVNKNGDAMSGTLTNTDRFIAKSSSIDRDGDNPSTLTSGTEFRLTDKSNLSVGGMYPQQETSGAIRNILYSRSGSSYNTFAVITDKDGTPRYLMSSPSAFRTAIGLNNVNNTSDLNKPISTATQTVLDSQQGQINYNTNNGVKNPLKINIPQKTVNGLTFTPQSDGTIIVNGTANVKSSSVVYFNLENPSNTTTATQHSLNKIGYGNFILSLNSGEEYMAGMNLQILCYDTITSSPAVTTYVSVGESKSITIGEDKKYVWFRLNISAAINGKTFDNFVLKPMIRNASIEDDTFESYAEPNSRLTRKVDMALEQTGYNLLKLTNQTVTTNNVTFSIDGAAGTITATRAGTQTANAYLNLDVPDTVYGKLCLSGCADGGDANTYSVYPWDATTNARPKDWGGTANAGTSIKASDYVEVNYVQGHTNRITIRITPTASFTSLTFTPMIVPAELAGIPFQPYAKSNAELTQDLDNTYIKHLSITCDTASSENPTVTAVDKTFTQIANAIQNGGLVFASLHWTRGTQIIYMSIIIDTFIVNAVSGGVNVITGTSNGGGTDTMYRLTWYNTNSLPTISKIS